MQIFETGSQLHEHIQALKKEGQTIGFVPTMGALHEGHLSLLKKAIKENDLSVCSVYVNPTQFNNPSDLHKYPRPIEADIASLEDLKCDFLYLPENSDIYPEGVKSRSFDYGIIAEAMEGKHRPGHFDGVGTIVSKLFDIVSPDHAYFGEKDFQQLAIIKKLVELIQSDVEIVGCDILREDDGLAMSSRNVRLTEHQRMASPLIYEALLTGKKSIASLRPSEVKEQIVKQINRNPELKVEYVEIADESTLQSVSEWTDYEHIRVFTAVQAGDVRLIDNLHLF